ncbi:MAG: hypothetical protein GVY08_08590 [Bacteroidetes bacterium]|jgi:hypothetical protein|nr:hypothetical protein [Bacteroidota bacterium]
MHDTTITCDDGTFSFTVPDGFDDEMELIISRVGYRSEYSGPGVDFRSLF